MKPITTTQAANILRNIANQNTTQGRIASVDTTNFASVATTVFNLGYDDVAKGILREFGKLRYMDKPITARLNLINESPSEWGAHRSRVRTLYGYALPEDDPSVAIADGDTFGTHTVKLPKHIQTHMYGRSQKMATLTITKEAMKKAFASLSSWTAYMNNLLTTVENQLTLQRQGISEASLLSYVLGKLATQTAAEGENPTSNGQHVVKLLSGYNAKFGKTYANLAAVKKSTDYPQYCRYVYQQLDEYATAFGNFDTRFHVNPIDAQPFGGNIPSQVNRDTIKMIGIKQEFTDMELYGLIDTRHVDFIPQPNMEKLTYWQSPEKPTSITGKATYALSDGTTTDTAATITNDNVLCVMFESDALGVGIVDNEVADTPYDAAKRVSNRYYHLGFETDIDYAAKGLVFVQE